VPQIWPLADILHFKYALTYLFTLGQSLKVKQSWELLILIFYRLVDHVVVEPSEVSRKRKKTCVFTVLAAAMKSRSQAKHI